MGSGAFPGRKRLQAKAIALLGLSPDEAAEADANLLEEALQIHQKKEHQRIEWQLRVAMFQLAQAFGGKNPLLDSPEQFRQKIFIHGVYE